MDESANKLVYGSMTSLKIARVMMHSSSLPEVDADDVPNATHTR